MPKQERKLSELLTEMAETLFRDPRKVSSSEAAHVALFLAHAAWNECVGLGGAREGYHNVWETIEADNPALWNELKSHDINAMIDELVKYKKTHSPDDQRRILTCSIPDNKVRVEWLPPVAPGVDSMWEMHLYGLVRTGQRDQAIQFLQETRRLSRSAAEQQAKQIASNLGIRQLPLWENRSTPKRRTVMRKKKKPPERKASSMRWEFAPNIPTHDLFESGSLDDTWNLQEAVDNFVYWVEGGRFLTWEAVVCEEQGVPLSRQQKRALGGLLNFNEDEDDEILYIDGVSRPSEPWHAILNKIVPHLLIDPFRTFDCQEEVTCDGWNQIVAALREHGEGLSLPPGVNSFEEVVPDALRHKLWLQWCFDDLSGLGQEKELTLENPEQRYRIELFIDHLRECRETVVYFDLTLDSLLCRVTLPDKDKSIFLTQFQEKLGLKSPQEQIACRL